MEQSSVMELRLGMTPEPCQICGEWSQLMATNMLDDAESA